MHGHQRYGAHEVIELHEVLNNALDALNTVQLYAPYATDPELVQLVNHQMNFMLQEYNAMVHMVNGLGAGESVPYRPRTQPYTGAGMMSGLHQSATQQSAPVQTAPVDNRDIASALLGMHKAGAKGKMAAALETAHPHIREMLVNGAVNCSHQAYEVWGYMQRKGLYPLAVLPVEANAQLLRGYQPLDKPNPAATSVPSNTAPYQVPATQSPNSNNGAVIGGEQPYSAVNANYPYVPAATQDNSILSVTADDASLSAAVLYNEAEDQIGVLTQQTEGKQPRGRKKTT